MRRFGGGALFVAALVTVCTTVLVPVLGTPPAVAQQDFVESDPAVVRAREQLASAQLAAHQAAAELEATTQERDSVQADIDAHEARIVELGRQRDELAAERDALKATMRERAVALYRNGGDGTGIATIGDASSALNAARRRTLGEAAAESNQRAAHKLEETRTQLAAVQATTRNEADQLQAEHARLDALAAQQEQRQAVVDQLVAQANAALEHARVIGALHAAGDPVMGPATLTAEQLAGWVLAQGFRPRIQTDLVSLAQLFIDEGRDENVRGDMAFAQSVIETGGFESAPANNFSGIGWCDTCKVGNQFPTPQEGVRAQIQLLRQYADADVTASQLSHPVSPYLYGADPVAAARKFDKFFAKGWAPTWRDMGNGNWATDPNYSGKVISVYNRMVASSQGG
ncbi:MAG TPA: glucosaminidase domain-containing protein [Acidimicrobiia bacterium]|nr:glucosaminidase domain-containing protein [Acidimicrobiia bacterium]